MTPDCCTRAWAKATGAELTFDTFQNRNEWTGKGDNERLWRPVPAPTSAEWLAEIVEAAWRLDVLQQTGWTPHDRSVKAFIKLWRRGESVWVSDETTAPDLRRALCSVLNGKPCEREAA